MTTIPAIVAAEPVDGEIQWSYQEIEHPRKPQEGEVLVRIVAVGICHTDIFCSALPEGALGMTYPKVFGHEGAGEVEAVGPGVTVAKPGDKVLLSYDYCGTCDLCEQDQPPYCINFSDINNVGSEGIFKNKEGKAVAGRFFGQSSFANVTIVSEKSVVNVQDIIHTPEELKRCAPLGCGLMTGTGAVLKEIKAHDIVIIAGLGAVGIGSIMTAKIIGCKAIIAVDRVASRLEIAKELGATHVYNTSESDDFVADIQALVEGQRITYALDTTGVPEIMEKCLRTVGKRGKLIQVGVPGLDKSVTLPLGDFFFQTKIFEVNFLGDAKSNELVPQMIKWYKEGKFPIDKIIKFYKASEVELALEEMKSGVIKPILKF